jgi:hypothetical protein
MFWTRPQIQINPGAILQLILRHRRTLSGPRVINSEQRGLYVKLARSQGAGGSRPSDRTWVFQIRSGVDRNGTRRPQHDQISTLQIQNASYTCHPSDLNRTAHNPQTRIGI